MKWCHLSEGGNCQLRRREKWQITRSNIPSQSHGVYTHGKCALPLTEVNEVEKMFLTHGWEWGSKELL